MPKVTSMLFFMFLNDEQIGMLQFIGIPLAVIGYFYIQAARSCPLNEIGRVVAETTFDRCTFVPIPLIYTLFMTTVPF